MKKFAIIALICLPLFSTCKRGEPIVADPFELAITTLSENFVCQPLAFGNNVIAVINAKNITYLCSYDKDGKKLWQNNIDGYAMGSLSIQNAQTIDLKKDPQNNLLLSMFSTLTNQAQQVISQNLKVVKFNQAGAHIGELSDSIHQPKKVFINPDSVNISGKGPFLAEGIVCLAAGNYAIISSLQISSIDSTYLQVSAYNSSLGFVSNSFFRIKGLRDFIHVYSDSQDRLFMISTVKGSTVSNLLLTDLNGNILFDTPTQSYIIDSYFFQETAGGQYILSTSYVTSDVKLRGALVCLTKTGQGVWGHVFDLDPSWIMLSMSEQTDGYIFSGFNSDAILLKGIDWRTTFTENQHQAVILKTNFLGQEIWHKILSGDFTSAGAVSIGNNPISCFGGKYESSGSNMFLIKLTDVGDIFYK